MRFFRGFALLLICGGCATSPPPEPPESLARRWDEFLSMPHYRAFALAGDPNGQWVGATVSGYRSLLDAGPDALRQCEKLRRASSISTPCRVYAIDDRIVRSDEDWKPTCDLTGHLDEVLESYVRSESAVETLVQLDAQLREMLPSSKGPYGFPHPCADPRYEVLGVWEGHYCHCIRYTGKLLREAHESDPYSSNRDRTLWSVVEGVHSATDLRLQAARYLDEFPNGPFAADALVWLGGLESDLAQTIEGLLAGNPIGFKVECYNPLIDDRPLADQLARAREQSVGYFQQALKLRPGDASIERYLGEVQAGGNRMWHGCAD